MATKINEGWISSSGAILAARKRDGGYIYFVNSSMTANGEQMSNNPVIAREISSINLEIMEAKQ